MKKRLLILSILILSFNGFAQTVNITVDPTQNRKNVSPYIYGRNNSLSANSSDPLSAAEWQKLKDAGIKLFRENSGNNSTKHNWRLNLTSAPDWYNNVYGSDWNYEATSLQQNMAGVKAMYAFQLIGKVANDASHNFDDWGYNKAQWWPGVAQNLAGGGTVNTDWNATKALVEGDPDLYTKDWPADSTVAILDKWFGSDPGSLNLDQDMFQYWNMDNEPEIWESTHDDVMPHQISAEEFMQKYFQVAKKARAKFPDIKLVGFVPCSEWFWYAYPNGAGNSGKIEYNGSSYTWIEFFIKRIGEEQQATGIKLIDVIDLHTYLSAENEAELMQAHRVFYDETYDYPAANGIKLLSPSGWDDSITKEYIFKRINDWLDQYFGANHGVTLGSTESGWNNTFDQMPQALDYASTLGVFANEGVELFTPWFWSPSYWEVVHLFSRYSKTVAVKSTSSDNNNISAYSTVNEDNDSLTIVLVNRYTSSKSVQVSTANFDLPNGTYQAYTLNNLPDDNSTETFVSHADNALESSTVTVSSGVFSTTLPAYSITSVILKGASGDYLDVTPSAIDLASANNSSDEITISSNVNWTASSNQTWLTVSSSSGSNNGSITATATENTTNAARTATVTITGTGVSSETVTITQSPQEILSVSPSTIDLAATNSSETITVTSNLSWAVSSNQTWLTVSPSTGNDNGTVTVEAETNPNATERSATVTIGGSGINRTVTVTQEGNPTTSMEDIKLNGKVFPNPVKDKLNIELEETITKVEIYNLNGARLLDEKVNKSTTEINVSKLKPGVYILEVFTKDNFFKRKILKE
jgi:hypothetical protein